MHGHKSNQITKQGNESKKKKQKERKKQLSLGDKQIRGYGSRTCLEVSYW